MQSEAKAQEDPEVEPYIRGLIDAAAHLRLPELFATESPGALYRIANRNGVAVVALRTSSLTEEQLVVLLRYRLAQYLAVNFVDGRMVYEARMEHEALDAVTPNDVHVVAGAVETGEILCYAALESPPEAPPGTTLRVGERPLFPVERVHGWGIFNRLLVLPDLPIAKLREFGRFVKNQRLHTFHELGVRGPVEVGVALFRTLAGPLSLEVEAIVADFEEGVAKQNLEFFHAPLVVLHTTVPYVAETSYFFPRYQYCTVYPCAALLSDIRETVLPRLDAVEQALAKPGKEGLLALFALKRESRTPKSSLEPPEGVAPIGSTAVPQQGVAMQARRQMLDVADQLRTAELFHGLSVAEATLLGTFMERTSAEAGAIIVHEGEASDDLYLIQSGEVLVQIGGHTGRPVMLATLGPGDFFGEIALFTGETRTADVVAATPVSLLRLSRDAYTRYLSNAIEVEQQISRAAAKRLRQIARTRSWADA